MIQPRRSTTRSRYAPSQNDGLIDVHAHFTTDEYISIAKNNGRREPDGMPEAYWPRWDAETHLRLMDEAGIAMSVLSMSSPGVHFGDERLRPVLAELDRRGAIAFLHPTNCAGHEALALGYPRPMIEFLFDTARTIVDLVLRDRKSVV